MSPEENPLRAVARHRRLSLLILLSFAFFAFALVTRMGIAATPFETTDSHGRPMGFNDPLSAEHYLIMLSNFHPLKLLNPERAYEWLLLAMQATGAWLLLSRPPVAVRLIRWFFALQPLLFPLGLLFIWAPPCVVFSLLTGVQDREGFTDVPFVASMGLVAHSTWVLASLIILFALRGPGLGLSQVGRAFAQASRAGRRTFVDALR